jgi:hypothetical protein
LIKRMRQSMAMDNRDQIIKDIDTLSLEKYVDEIVGAALEGIARCKTEKDVWSAVEVNLFILLIIHAVRPSHVDHISASPPFPCGIYAGDCVLIICRTGCAFQSCSRCPCPRTARERRLFSSHPSAASPQSLLRVGVDWDNSGRSRSKRRRMDHESLEGTGK